MLLAVTNVQRQADRSGILCLPDAIILFKPIIMASIDTSV
jgi:hypothetical protein